MLPLSRPNIPDDALEQIGQVLDSGMLVFGKQGEAFEAALAEFLGAKHVVAVSSGTAALHLSYMALNLSAQDWVIVPDFTFPATASAAIYSCLKPYIVDVDPQRYTMCPKALEHALANWPYARKPKAIMLVHEFGAPADMHAIEAIAKHHNLPIIEDAACAIGAQHETTAIGANSLLASFSFHPRKTLTTGEGGAIATHDAALAKRLRQMRSHGMQRSANGTVSFEQPGLNYRLTDFQAALGASQLPHLPGWLAKRRELAACYLEALAGLEAAGKLSLPQAVKGHSWQTFMLVLDDSINRDSVIDAMKQRGFQLGLGAQSVCAVGFAHGGNEAITTGPHLFKQGLALPFCEQYSQEQLHAVAAALTEVLQ